MIPSYAVIEEPDNGTWVADITTTEEPTGTFELGEITWQGALTPSGAIADGAQWHTRIVGGRGKLNTKVPARNYASSIGYAQIAQDIISACGETMGSVSLGGKRAPYYERIEMSAGRALTMLCKTAGGLWWIGRDGKLNVALTRPAGAIVPDDAQQLHTTAQTATVSVMNAGAVSPGMMIGGRLIRGIRWSMRAKLNAECSFESVIIPDDTAALNYATCYRAKVSTQNADGSVDVIVDERFKIARCELLSGFPGSSVQVKAGESVTVGWYGGRPTAPYAFGFSQVAAAALHYALVNDAVELILPPFTFTGLMGVPPAGVPVSGVMVAVIPKTLGKVVGPGSQRNKGQ